MAIKGTFTADFSSFNTAVEQADIKLKAFQADSSKVGTALSNMVNQFTGQKIISEATLMAEAVERIGGTSKLTASELERVSRTAGEAAEKFRAMGQDVPAKIQNLADASKNAADSGVNFNSFLSTATALLGSFGVELSIQGLINFGKAIIADADALTKLSDRTGISVDRLQDLQYAGDDAGVSIETMANAINTLQERLGKGDAGATGALKALGVNMKDFLALEPGDQITTLVDRLHGLSDPLERARLAADLFGKNWKELIPVIIRGVDDIKNAHVGMTTEAVTAWDSIGDAATHASRRIRAAAAEAILDTFPGMSKEVRALNDEVNRLRQTAEGKVPSPFAGQAFVPPGLPDDLKAIEDALTTTVEDMGAAADATNLYADAIVEMSKIMDDFEKKTHGLAMKNEKELAEERAKNLKTRNDQEVANFTTLQKLTAENADFVKKQTLSETQYKLEKIDEWEKATVAAYALNGPSAQQLAAFTEAVKTRADQQRQAFQEVIPIVTLIGKSAADVEAERKKGAKDTGDAVVDEYRRQQEAFMNFKGVVVAGTQSMVDAAMAGVASQQAFTQAINGTDAAAAQWQLNEAKRMRGEIFLTGMSGPRLGVETRQGGGPVSSGQLYLVGEHGPELFRPTGNGDILPTAPLMSGSPIGGATVVNHFYVNGSVKDLARPLMDEITRTMKQGRQWPAAS